MKTYRNMADLDLKIVVRTKKTLTSTNIGVSLSFDNGAFVLDMNVEQKRQRAPVLSNNPEYEAQETAIWTRTSNTPL